MIKIYQVGGYVRDQFLGIKSNDIDFSVEASSFEEMHEYVKANCKQIYLVKPEYLTIRALHKDFGAVDYVMCRKDGYYSDNRRPDEVIPGDIYDDLARRDFTINAMAIDENNNIIDPFDGQLHLREKFIVCVGSTEKRFEEDPLRILRAMRFSITKGFNLSYEIQLVFYNDSYWIPKLKSISQERIREELQKCFTFSTSESLSFLRKVPLSWSEELFKEIWLKPTLEKI